MPHASLDQPGSASSDAQGSGGDAGARAPGRLLSINASANFVLAAYTATTFLSALLLFSVQPMFAKMVLPVLGGSPSVWAVAIFFFQESLMVCCWFAHCVMGK